MEEEDGPKRMIRRKVAKCLEADAVSEWPLRRKQRMKRKMNWKDTKV